MIQHTNPCYMNGKIGYMQATAISMLPSQCLLSCFHRFCLFWRLFVNNDKRKQLILSFSVSKSLFLCEISSTIAISVDWIIRSGSTVVKCRVVTTASIRSFMDMVVLIGFDTNRKVIKSVVIKIKILSFYQKCLSILAYSSIFGEYFSV